ncbi:hypothetical protein FF1_028767 [Malus domestica]|uniref:Uncharacterized protein n=1 Tax=Malus domestica TaxID=3750 RepID=A0A498KBM7_MALDO|nr:uncharacterized protein LOC126617309 [Malus sylvestris]XP_050141295.1 uncharacterized protein LOC126617309 [Malus sylvestris]RXI03774.1 hypothetical protein DVH24_038048 [Malus domestica]
MGVIHGEYRNLYVHISAETYEKVDAAVAVIELLLTSVSGNLAAVSSTGASVPGDHNAHVPSQVQDTTTSNVVNQGNGTTTGSICTNSINGQFQYPGSFFSTGPSFCSHKYAWLHSAEFFETNSWVSIYLLISATPYARNPSAISVPPVRARLSLAQLSLSCLSGKVRC